jgi:hypothetical protein
MPGATSSRPPPALVLPPRIAVDRVAAACRNAFLEILNAPEGSVRRATLAEWLDRRYRTLTRLGRPPESSRDALLDAINLAKHARLSRPSFVVSVTERQVQDVVAAARAKLLVWLKELSEGETGVAAAYELMVSGVVERCVDGEGASGWVPVDVPRLPLVERIRSLVAVDFLQRAEDYERALVVCPQCHKVAFDAETRARGACADHRTSVEVLGPGVEAEPAVGAA